MKVSSLSFPNEIDTRATQEGAALTDALNTIEKKISNL